MTSLPLAREVRACVQGCPPRIMFYLMPWDSADTLLHMACAPDGLYFPKNHNLVLFAQTSLMHKLRLTVNEDIRSRITYSVMVQRLNPDDIRSFILAQLDRVKLATTHSARRPSL